MDSELNFWNTFTDLAFSFLETLNSVTRISLWLLPGIAITAILVFPGKSFSLFLKCLKFKKRLWRVLIKSLVVSMSI